MGQPLKIEAASEFTGVPVPTLRWYRATNQGPRSYVLAGRVVYDLADLQAWRDEQKAQSVRGGVINIVDYVEGLADAGKQAEVPQHA